MHLNYNILSASSIDYSNIDEICCYQILMCRIFERETGFASPYVRNTLICEIQNQGFRWLKKVKDLINDIVSAKSGILDLSVIPKLLCSYDLFYRVCNRKPAYDYIRNVRLKVAARWAKGDKSLPETFFVIDLLREIYRDNKTLDRKYSSFALSVFGGWVKELMCYGTFRNIPLVELYSRLSFIIDNDLLVYLDVTKEAIEKSRWINRHLLSDDELDLLDAETLLSYIDFAQAAFIYNNMFEENNILHARLFSKLSLCVDLHPLLREAIEIELAEFQTA